MAVNSNGRTVLSANVAKDRVITKFPQAYHADATPYQKMNFHSKVRDACQQSKTGTVGLKICKAVLVGDSGVGKSCLVNRFCHDVFDRDYKATIGVDFEVEKFSVLSVPFNLQVWDTAGQERYRTITAAYYRAAHVVMVVFDLSDIESLSNARRWKEDACLAATDPLVFLVGTKKDLVSESAYSDIEREAIQMANDLGAEFWAVSSKTGEYVKEFFFRVVSLTFDNAVQQEYENITGPSKQIGSGNSQFKITKEEDVYERKKSKFSQCCK